VLSQFTQSFLFGVQSTAPHVFVASSAVLTVVAVIATLIPAIRASRLDPVRALRG
jgi:ABC-type antimicrobial peptide transport system permease subunit